MQMRATPARPACVVFDLDGCLWHPDMYMMRGGAPFKPQDDGTMLGTSNECVTLHSGVRMVMNELADDPSWKGTTVAVASCCDEPLWARDLLRKFELNAAGRKLEDVIDMPVCLIRFGNKQDHLKDIADVVGCSLEQMIFFDNEPYNCTNVAAIGVTCVYCPSGVTKEMWRKVLADYPRPGEILGARLPRRRRR